MVIPKVGKLNALSKPVTSNSAPSSRESTVMNNERVIAPGIFRINPFKASRVDNFVPNKHVKASVRTKPITVSQPHVITKNDVNSKTNGFLLKTLKALLGPKDHSLGTILRVIRKIIATSESVSQSDCSKGDNAYTSNPQEPINKRFQSSTFSMTGCQNCLDTLQFPLLSEYKPKDKEHHEDNECDI
ncbi:hypothetical protein Tco_0563620 [Tanacetum coccineum]